MTTRKAAYSRGHRHNSSTYRSGLEESNAKHLQALGVDSAYEAYEIEYIVPASKHKYTPDFVLPNGIVIETKGVWDAEDRRKHLLLKEQYPQLDIRFVFNRSKQKLYKGSKTTYGKFCEQHCIKYADKLIPTEWVKEGPKNMAFKDASKASDGAVLINKAERRLRKRTKD